MCNSLVGKRVRVEYEGTVEQDGDHILLVRPDGGCAEYVPCSACTVIAPEIREGDQVEVIQGRCLVRGIVSPPNGEKPVDSCDNVRILYCRNPMKWTWFKKNKLTIRERADGTKP